MTVLVLIPAVEGIITPKSGVVTGGDRAGAPLGHFRVWFEGNAHGAVNLNTWADRIHCATDRMLNGYPTTAVRNLPAEQFRAIGFYDPEKGEFDWQVPHWRSALSEWLGKPVTSEDITTTLAHHEKQRAIARLRQGSPQQQLLAKMLPEN